MSHHLHDLSTKHQGQQKSISGMFEGVKALEIKAKLTSETDGKH
jgi:hypothetical protein